MKDLSEPTTSKFLTVVTVLIQIVVALCLYNFKTSLDSVREIFSVQFVSHEKRIDKIESRIFPQRDN